MSETRCLMETAKKGQLAQRGLIGEFVAESIKAKKFDPQRFNLREAAEVSMGLGWEAALRSHQSRRSAGRGEYTAESTEAIDLSSFIGVAGNVAILSVEQGYMEAMRSFKDLVDVYPTPDDFAEKTVAYEAELTEKPRDVGPNMEYPKTGAAMYNITLPAPVKRGLIGQLTLEMVKANAGKRWLDLTKKIGNEIGADEREDIENTIWGLKGTFVRNGVSYSPYLLSGAYANALDDFNEANGIVEYDRIEQLFNVQVDPYTGRNIELREGGTSLIIPASARFITGKNLATNEIRTTVNSVQYVSGNPLTDYPTPIESRQARRLITATGVTGPVASTYKVYGDTKAAIGYREVEPFRVLERNDETASDVAFYQDCVYAVKGRRWGVTFWKNPLYVARVRNTSAT